MVRITARTPGARVRAERAVAVHCGRRALVVASAQAGRGRPRLDLLEVLPFTADLFEAHGTPAACCATLLPGLVARHGLRGRRAVVVMESARTVARFWAAPLLAEKDKLGALGFEAEKWCQTPAAQLWLGSLDSPPAGSGPAAAVAPGAEEGTLAVAAPAETVASLLGAVAAAGLEPWGVTVPALALESLLGEGAETHGGDTAVAVHIGAERSWLAVCSRGRMIMVRELEVARDGLAAALSIIPVEGRGSVRLTPDEVEDLLTRVGWVGEDEPFGMANDRVPLESLKYALRPALERLASSLGRSLDFCREQFFVEIPESIALTGEGADVPNLDAWLGANLQARFVRGVSWEGRVDLTAEDAAQWARMPELASVAAGACVGGLRGRVLPARPTSLGLPRWFALPVRRALAGATALLAIACLLTGVQVDRQRARHDAAARLVADSQARLETARREWRVWEAGRAERQLLAIFARENVRVDGILKLISRTVGQEVSLTELSLPSVNAGLLELGAVAPTDATGAAVLPRERDILTLNGVVRTDRERLETTLARLIIALENAPFFEHVTFVRSEEQGERAAAFELRCRIRQGLRADDGQRVVANR